MWKTFKGSPPPFLGIYKLNFKRVHSWRTFMLNHIIKMSQCCKYPTYNRQPLYCVQYFKTKSGEMTPLHRLVHLRAGQLYGDSVHRTALSDPIWGPYNREGDETCHEKCTPISQLWSSSSTRQPHLHSSRLSTYEQHRLKVVDIYIQSVFIQTQPTT